MGRTRQVEPARKRLLAAADELFYNNGICSTGVDAVVSRARVATGSLYNNFGSKDELVAAYLEARGHRWADVWDACVAACTDPVDRVLAIFSAMEDGSGAGTKQRGCAHVAAVVQLERGTPGMAAALAHKRYVKERLQELVAATDVGDPAQTTRDILMVYEGMFNQLAMDLDPDPIGTARRLAAGILRPQV